MIRRVGLVAAATALSVALVATPARAQESVDGGEWDGSSVARPPTVTTDPGSTVVEGRFERDRPYSQPSVQVTVTPPSGLHPSCPHGDPRSIPASVTAEDPATITPVAYRFRAGVPFGPGACNGTYGVRIVADAIGDPDPVLTTTIDVAVPPVPVVGVTAERVDGRRVRVSWTAPADPPPDLVGYYVIRTSSAGDVTSFTVNDPAQTGFDDTDPPAEGGETRYQVVARRSAPGGEVTSSGGDAPTPVEVDPAPDDSAAPGGSGGDGGSGSGGGAASGGTSGGAGGGSGLGSRVRPPLVGTSSGRFPPLRAPSPPTTVDGGFGQTLPFDDLEEGDADPVLPDDELASSIFEDEAGRGLAIPVATALLLAVWAFHLRYLARASRPVG